MIDSYKSCFRILDNLSALLLLSSPSCPPFSNFTVTSIHHPCDANHTPGTTMRREKANSLPKSNYSFMLLDSIFLSVTVVFSFGTRLTTSSLRVCSPPTRLYVRPYGVYSFTCSALFVVYTPFPPYQTAHEHAHDDEMSHRTQRQRSLLYQFQSQFLRFSYCPPHTHESMSPIRSTTSTRHSRLFRLHVHVSHSRTSVGFFFDFIVQI